MKALPRNYRIGDLCAAFDVSRERIPPLGHGTQASARARKDALLGEELRRSLTRTKLYNPQKAKPSAPASSTEPGTAGTKPVPEQGTGSTARR